MATRNPTSHSHSYDYTESFTQTTSETRHCKEDALSPREFERFFESTYRIDDTLVGLQARFIAVCAGRLGLRAGEIVHMDESWVDAKNEQINIPSWEECTTGRGGTPCALCCRLAEQKHDIAVANIVDHLAEREGVDAIVQFPAGLHEYGVELPTHAELLETMWSPKTQASVRSVPYGHEPRNSLVIDEFFDYWSEFPVSYQSIRRRVDTTAELTRGLDPATVYPHCLRSTAATYLSGRGLNAVALKAMLGWEQLATAQRYLSESDVRLQRALNATH